MKISIGFIGLGVMGGPMATHLSKAGHPMSLFDAAPGVAAQLAASLSNASAPRSLREVAEASEVIVTMLPNGRVVRDVVFAENGLAAGLKSGSLVLDNSSAEPWITREVAARLLKQGVHMVDAPVSGAVQGAKAAELVFMVGGAKEDVERVTPLLNAMGKSIFHLGGIGAGHTMKCLNNLVTAITLTATAESLAIGTRAGLDPAKMVDVMNESTGGSWITKTHIHQRVLNRSFDDPFKLELMLKDMGIALALAHEHAVPSPVSANGYELWQAASIAQGKGASISEIVRWVEGLSGTVIKSPEDAAG